jgi:glycopeptide antibiotics resistance protein
LNKVIKISLLVIYLALLVSASLWPTPVDGGGFIWQLTSEILKVAQTVPWLSWLQYSQLEALANMLLYLPLGVFLVLFIRKAPLWILLITPAVFSIVVEGIQRFFLPARYSTLDDVINNCIGGALGVLIAAGIRQWRTSKP